MAYQSVWYSTKLPKKVVDLIEEDLIENFDPDFKESRLYGDIDNKDITLTKLAIVHSVKIILNNGLNLLGVKPLEIMK